MEIGKLPRQQCTFSRESNKLKGCGEEDLIFLDENKTKICDFWVVTWRMN